MTLLGKPHTQPSAKSLNGLVSRFRRDECGAYAVEFAIVFPVLLLMVFGAIEIGRMFYDKDRLSRVTMEGARLLLIQPTLTDDALKTQIQALANQTFPSGSVAITVTSETRDGLAFKKLTADYTHLVAAGITPFHTMNLNSTMRVVAPSAWYTPPPE
jgi:Flp pilus assembly protein TadG